MPAVNQPDTVDIPTFIAIASTALLGAAGWAVTWFMGERKTFLSQLRCLEEGMAMQAQAVVGLSIHKDTHAEKLEEIRGSITETCGKLDRIIERQNELFVALQLGKK